MASEKIFAPPVNNSCPRETGCVKPKNMENTPRTPTLAEAVTGLVAFIIAMIPALIRARGLRALLELPAYVRLARELYRMEKEFLTLLAAFKAGTLPPVPPAPTPAIEPEPWTAGPTEAAIAPEPRLIEARPAPARPRRPASKRAVAPRAPVAPKPPAISRRPSHARPRPSRAQFAPFAAPGLSAGILVTARCR